MNKKGDLELDTLGKWILIGVGLIILFVAIIFLKDKLGGYAEYTKHLFGLA